MSATALLTCTFVIFVNGQTWQENRNPRVVTQLGVVEGVSIYTDSSKIVNSFLGIPYAAPPVGELRFSPPQKHQGWNGTFQATKPPSRCPQLPLRPGLNDVEDCLYVNVWSNERKYLPVIVFFEGLDFFTSSSISVSGQDLAAEDFVVVTVNYRLNVFGFFCLGTPQTRGNLGILDQYFALRWVKENIQQFGGDPDKVTLFGYLSGADSVALHIVSPRTSGLFKKAIISSGSALAPWQIDNDPIIASKEVIKLLDCDLYTPDILECLQSKRVEDILQALQTYSESNLWSDKFLPVADTFLPENARYFPIEPATVLKEGKFPQIPILTGIAKPIAYPQLRDWSDIASQGSSQLQQYMERAKIPEIMRLYRFNGASKDDITELIKWKYASSNQGEVRVLIDQLKNLEFESKVEAPHFLLLSHLINYYVQSIFVYYMGDLGIGVNTTDHLATSDMLLLFGPVLMKQFSRRRFYSNEMEWSAHVKQLWRNFIVVDTPTLNNVRSNSWRRYTANDPYIEFFQTAQLNVTEETKKINKRVSFWNQLLPKIAQHRNAIANSIPKELQNSPDPAAGFRHAMYTLVGLVVALLALLIICIVLLKKRSKERERHIHLGY